MILLAAVRENGIIERAGRPLPMSKKQRIMTVHTTLLVALIFLCISYSFLFTTTFQNDDVDHAKKCPHIQQSTSVIYKEEPLQHLQYMQNRNLCLSFKHQHKLFSVKDQVLSWVKKYSEHHRLLQTTGKGGRLFAFIINENCAF